MRVRFAPSPTGALHIGGARTALYNWLLAHGPAQAADDGLRATLVLRFYCDLDVEQSAAVLGCSAGTVKSQTSKGLAALRRMLEPAWGPGSVPRGGGSDRG